MTPILLFQSLSCSESLSMKRRWPMIRHGASPQKPSPTPTIQFFQRHLRNGQLHSSNIFSQDTWNWSISWTISISRNLRGDTQVTERRLHACPSLKKAQRRKSEWHTCLSCALTLSMESLPCTQSSSNRPSSRSSKLTSQAKSRTKLTELLQEDGFTAATQDSQSSSATL